MYFLFYIWNSFLNSFIVLPQPLNFNNAVADPALGEPASAEPFLFCLFACADTPFSCADTPLACADTPLACANPIWVKLMWVALTKF